MKIIHLALFVALLIVLGVYISGGKPEQHRTAISHDHVFDKAGIISPGDLSKFEWLLDLIEKESDLDIKFLFVKNPAQRTGL